MKAVRQTQYGPPDVLQIQEVEKPAPQGQQVLVRVRAASINAGDYRVMRADPFFIRLMGMGLLRPKDPRVGSDVAGVVEAVGPEVTQFQPGDAVFGCGKGSIAEYVLARETYLVRKPGKCSFEDAAAVPVAALTALQALRDTGKIQPGQNVLIQGASGGVGMFAVQLARAFGAHVTAVVSPRNLDLARSFGAERVLDYTREDFTRAPEKYDLILAVNGYHSLFAYRRALNPNGVYVCAGGTMPQFFEAMLLGPALSKNGDKKLGSMGIAKVNQPDLLYLANLLETGQLAPFIDRAFPFSEAVAAFRYIEAQHAQGKVVITMGEG